MPGRPVAGRLCETVPPQALGAVRRWRAPWAATANGRPWLGWPGRIGGRRAVGTGVSAAWVELECAPRVGAGPSHTQHGSAGRYAGGLRAGITGAALRPCRGAGATGAGYVWWRDGRRP